MPTTSFLPFGSRPPRIFLTAPSQDFDDSTLSLLRAESFSVTYIPFSHTSPIKTFHAQLSSIPNKLSLGESYALIAYGAAATAALDFYSKPARACGAVIAYYPDAHPGTAKGKKKVLSFPSQLEVLCHFSGGGEEKVGMVVKEGENVRKYTYEGTQPGFAEEDLEEYNAVSAGLAWTRTLEALNKVFGVKTDLEKKVDEFRECRFGKEASARKTLGMMGPAPHVNNVPTLTGGVGQKDLFVFYRDYFVNRNPPSFRMKLISRTIGVDRVVDEIVISFRHTQEMPWILPGVPPTDKVVHIALVSIVLARGGKLSQEHVYWDQASVLVQCGLLDPKLVPNSFKGKGLEQLPVYASQAANKLLDRDSVPSNELIPHWQPVRGDPGASANRSKQTANGTGTNGT